MYSDLTITSETATSKDQLLSTQLIPSYTGVCCSLVTVDEGTALHAYLRFSYLPGLVRGAKYTPKARNFFPLVILIDSRNTVRYKEFTP